LQQRAQKGAALHGRGNLLESRPSHDGCFMQRERASTGVTRADDTFHRKSEDCGFCLDPWQHKIPNMSGVRSAHTVPINHAPNGGDVAVELILPALYHIAPAPYCLPGCLRLPSRPKFQWNKMRMGPGNGIFACAQFPKQAPAPAVSLASCMHPIPGLSAISHFCRSANSPQSFPLDDPSFPGDADHSRTLPMLHAWQQRCRQVGPSCAHFVYHHLCLPTRGIRQCSPK
jgi:hypothetical protein